MKNKSLYALLPFLLLLSCNKPLPTYSTQNFDYTITGIGDTSIPANDYISFNSTITLVSGNPVNNPVTVTFKGIPDSVAIQKNNFSFRLSYDLQDTFVARNAPQGVYPMQAIFTSAAGTKTYNFNLTVAKPTDRVALVSGYYYPSNTCAGMQQYVSCTIAGVPGAANEIMLIDRISASTYDTCYGMVDCCTNTFVMPSQDVQGNTVYGNGSFGGGVVHLNRTITIDTVTYPCIVTLSHD